MTDSGGWPGDETAVTQVMALPPAERRVLAALAIVGRASLSPAELAEISELDDVQSVIDDLERRGLIKRDERRRYSALGRVGEQIRETDDALATGDRLLQYMTTLARGGTLTPERLVEDAEAILGLSGWAAETRQWAALLELVKTLQACFGIAHRAEEWLTLLERGRIAARALGDQRSEIWMLQQMATASASAGNASAASEYSREAAELQRGGAPSARRVAGTDEAVSAGGRAVVGNGGGVPRWVLWTLGLVVAAGIGIGAGYAIGSDNGTVGETTARVSVTVTLPGRTVTTSDTVTLPATTVVSTSTQLTTTTITATTTVTVVG
jgi:DNA-binding MarR family transcriptional regulator